MQRICRPTISGFFERSTASSHGVLTDVFPRPVFLVGFEEEKGAPILHWYVHKLSDIKLPWKVDIKGQAEEELCRGIPAIDIMFSGTSARLSGIEFHMGLDSLEEVASIKFGASDVYRTPVFDLDFWNITKGSTHNIRAIRAPIRFTLQSDLLIVHWSGNGAEANWISVSEEFHLAFDYNQGLLGFAVQGPDVAGLKLLLCKY